MNKKKIIVILSILVIIIVIASLYGTFASNSTVDSTSSATYSVNLTNSTSEVTVPGNSSKTIFYKLNNTNKGTVKYGIVYSGSNITVRVYSDSNDPETGLINYGENKFIKLYVQNTGSSESTATITTVLGYENGGNLIVPSGKTLVTEVYIKNQALVTLTNLGLSVDTTHTPDFTTISGNDGVLVNGDIPIDAITGDNTNGIYEAEDDLGISYYFRGAVQNNYVSFANIVWRIVRINGDGTIRMITEDKIGSSVFNENNNDNAYVGYMYGTISSSSYENTHANTNNSTIKTFIDNWYQSNLSSYSKYIADAIYCNDRSVTTVNSAFGTFTGNGSGTQKSAYSGFIRIFINHTPTLICPNNNDKFTLNSNLGNGALTYPIGLLTSDELSMSGALAYGYYDKYGLYLEPSNYNYYLDKASGFYTMTPYQFDNYARIHINQGVANAELGGGTYGSDINLRNTDLSLGVRPVISLNADAISGGSGTETDPFVVG